MSKAKNLVLKHRRKFIIASVIIGGSFMALKYSQRILIRYHEQQTKEFFERNQRVQHYVSLERTCNHVILGMGIEISNMLIEHCSIEELLKTLRNNPSNKIQVWEEIKVLAFTRITSLVYASSFLVVALRIQMSILGGYLYRDKITDETQISDDLKQQYLSIIKFFVQDYGIKNLIRNIKAKVCKVVGPLKLNKRVSCADMEQIFCLTQHELSCDGESDPISEMAKYLFPLEMETNRNMHMSGTFLNMWHETLDLLECYDAIDINGHNVSKGFSITVDAIAEAMFHSQNLMKEASNSSFEVFDKGYDKTKTEVPVVKIIPILADISSNEAVTSMNLSKLATLLLTCFMNSEKNKMFGANIYETFSSPP